MRSLCIARPFSTVIFLTLFSLVPLSANADGGTIAFRGLLTGIDGVWTFNTSGKSFATWVSEGNTAFARIAYSTTHDYGFNYQLQDRTRKSIYVKFWARQEGGTAYGPKNFKIFGQGYPTFYSNTTIGISGNEYDLAYGDSASGSNDTTVAWRFTGVTYGGTVLTRSSPTVVTKLDAPITIDNNWHEWGYYVRFNDDNTPNGEVIVRYDNKEVFHLKNVYNRANGAGPIDNFGLGQWFQPPGGSYSMARDYRDVRVAYDTWPDSTDTAGNFVGSGTAVRPEAPVLKVQ